MREIRIATAQFENHKNDKTYNLSRIRELTRKATDQGAEICCFHEGCIPAYSWIQPLTKQQMLDIAEHVPDGQSVKELINIAKEFSTVVMAGLVEKDEHDRIFNTYVTVSHDGFITKFRKLHAFINPHLNLGNSYHVIDILGCKIGFLICYDNNLPENPRCTTMLGAEIIIAPHVTACLPLPGPGTGIVDRKLWDNRHKDPVSLRQQFDGPKGRGWLMRWLPTRAYENGVYYVFSNPIGWDFDGVRPGLAMIIDPYGEVVTECRTLGDDIVTGLLTPDKLENNLGKLFINARRPELYSKLVEPHESVIMPGWKRTFDE